MEAASTGILGFSGADVSGEGSAEDGPGQVGHGRFIFRSKAVPAEDLESGMALFGIFVSI